MNAQTILSYTHTTKEQGDSENDLWRTAVDGTNTSMEGDEEMCSSVEFTLTGSYRKIKFNVIHYNFFIVLS